MFAQLVITVQAVSLTPLTLATQLAALCHILARLANTELTLKAK